MHKGVRNSDPENHSSKLRITYIPVHKERRDPRIVLESGIRNVW
jgi:hypothetical protein